MNNNNYTEEKLNKYKERKKAIYSWYKYSNKFLEKVDEIEAVKVINNL